VLHLVYVALVIKQGIALVISSSSLASTSVQQKPATVGNET